MENPPRTGRSLDAELVPLGVQHRNVPAIYALHISEERGSAFNAASCVVKGQAAAIRIRISALADIDVQVHSVLRRLTLRNRLKEQPGTVAGRVTDRAAPQLTGDELCGGKFSPAGISVWLTLEAVTVAVSPSTRSGRIVPLRYSGR